MYLCSMEKAAVFPSPQLQAALKLAGFKVSRNSAASSRLTAFGRRHFYKIVLSVGKVTLHYGDHITHLNGVYLFFANPRIPYAAEVTAGRTGSYSCVFTEGFLQPIERLDSVQRSPLFTFNGTPAFKLNKQQQTALTNIFEGMIAAETSDYVYKGDLIRSYIQQIIHEALHIQPESQPNTSGNAAWRITTQFLELLERQFPIDNMQASIRLKSAQDFAARLHVHVNYLNRAVKTATGRSTTTLIAERITAEATALLKHTDWNIADIAYALGFEYPNYFSNFFKKTTGRNPTFYRAQKV